MAHALLLQIPADLHVELDPLEFEEVESFRGPQEWLDASQPVLSIAESGFGVAADFVTVLVARESLGGLTRGVKRWASRSKGASGEPVLTLEVVRRANGREARLHLEATGAEADGELAKLHAFLQEELD